MKYLISLLSVFFMVFTVPHFVQAVDHDVTDPPKEEAEDKTPQDKPERLFVLSGEEGTFDDETLTIEDIDTVIYFSDQPKREAGQMTLEKFAKDWDGAKEKEKGKVEEAPKATLSIVTENGVNKAEVVLVDSQVKDDDTITYKVKVLKGDVPKSFKEASLFINGLP